MAKSNFIESLDDKIFNAVLRANSIVQTRMPITAIIESFLQTSFESMTPEQQVQILTDLGPEWYLPIAARMEKRIRKIDQSL